MFWSLLAPSYLFEAIKLCFKLWLDFFRREEAVVAELLLAFTMTH
jgi:hypothetical protein